MLLSFRINPSVTAKVTASPRATCLLFFFLTHLWYGVSDLCAFGPTEGLSPHADVPVLLGSACDIEEPLINLEEAAAIVKSLCGSPANAAFSGFF